MTAVEDYLQPEGGWRQPVETRLPPPPPSQRGVAFRAISGVSKLFGREELPRIFPVLNTNRRLFWPWLWFASRLMPFGRLPADLREKLILRTAWHCRSRYEWGQHVEIALSAGVSDADIVALATGHDDADPSHAAALRACDDLCREKLISDANWQVLAGHFKPAALVEITVLVGHYEMVAGLLINSGIDLEPSIDAVLADFNRRARDVRLA